MQKVSTNESLQDNIIQCNMPLNLINQCCSATTFTSIWSVVISPSAFHLSKSLLVSRETQNTVLLWCVTSRSHRAGCLYVLWVKQKKGAVQCNRAVPIGDWRHTVGEAPALFREFIITTSLFTSALPAPLSVSLPLPFCERHSKDLCFVEVVAPLSSPASQQPEAPWMGIWWGTVNRVHSPAVVGEVFLTLFSFTFVTFTFLFLFCSFALTILINISAKPAAQKRSRCVVMETGLFFGDRCEKQFGSAK